MFVRDTCIHQASLNTAIQTSPALLVCLSMLPSLPQTAAAAAIGAGAAVYRDVLHGAGVVDVLLTALTDAAVLTDLLLVQVGEHWGLIVISPNNSFMWR